MLWELDLTALKFTGAGVAAEQLIQGLQLIASVLLR
jgi:hypothetical protein